MAGLSVSYESDINIVLQHKRKLVGFVNKVWGKTRRRASDGSGFNAFANYITLLVMGLEAIAVGAGVDKYEKDVNDYQKIFLHHLDGEQ